MPRRLHCLTLTPAVLALAVLQAHADKPRKPRPALPAAQYSFHDTHAHEQVTVAAEPGDTSETRPDTRLDYFHHGFMPIHVIVTNDSARALTLDDARIHLVDANNTVIPAATDDDLQRRLFELKSVKGRTVPLPAPLPSIHLHDKPVDKKIVADDTDFGFPTTTVAPHTTVSGYLYYDVRDLDEPVLAKATLELRKAEWSDTKQQLDSFEVPLKPSTHSKPDASKPDASKPDTTKP